MFAPEYTEASDRPSAAHQAHVDAAIAENARRKKALREKTAMRGIYAKHLAYVIEAIERAARTNALIDNADEPALMGMLLDAKTLLAKAA